MLQKGFILNKNNNNNNNKNTPLQLSKDNDNNLGLTQSISLLNKKTNELDIKINELNNIFHKINNNTHVINMQKKMVELEQKMDNLLLVLSKENEKFNIKNNNYVIDLNSDFEKFKKYTLDIYHEVLEIKNVMKNNEQNNIINDIVKDITNISQKKSNIDELNIDYFVNFNEQEKKHINRILQFLND